MNATASTTKGVANTCRAKWVQDPLTATGSANIHYHSRSWEYPLLQLRHVVHFRDFLLNPILSQVTVAIADAPCKRALECFVLVHRETVVALTPGAVYTTAEALFL